jgi:hypothetical protein
MWRPYLGAALLWAIYVIAIPIGRAQEISSANEIPIERCDRLPVVRALIGKTEFRFLLDTGATTVLNLKSFSGGKTRDIEVTSWTGTAATSAREVSVKELSIGNHLLRDLKLPAIDLSPIGNACGGPIDGILGVDLLDKMEVSIDLKRQVASLGGEPVDPKRCTTRWKNPWATALRTLSTGKRKNSNSASIQKSCCTRRTVNSAGEHR